ncbi:uncharacterized protein [Hyperolius riggenbachi]|uniref:uncharacterized protein n=1 Tax=Hyperolius riggenbachi TaxID=752182 RepID=UPI0035A3AC86
MISLLLFLLFLPISSGVVITDIHINMEDVYVEKGSRVMIPCMFFVDKPLKDDRIDLEWGMTPEEGGVYTPIVRLIDTTMLRLEHPNQRAGVFPYRVRKGFCNMVIDQAKPEDSGKYELHLAVNGIQYNPVPTVSIHITECSVKATDQNTMKDQDYENQTPNVIQPPDAPPVNNTFQKVTDDQTSVKHKGSRGILNRQRKLSKIMAEDQLQTETQQLGKKDFGPEAMRFMNILQVLKDRGLIQYAKIAAVMVIFLLLLGSIIGCIFGMLYCQLKRTDVVKAMEEGHIVEETILDNSSMERET